jgi:hypothetical protein
MKDPDALDYAFAEAENRLKARADADGVEYSEDLDNDMDDIQEAVRPWFQYGEYLTVEIDTETGSAHIVRP